MLRAFGSKDQLYVQAVGSIRTPGQSVEPAVGEVDGAIGQIYDDYERIGDRVTGRLAEEHRMPALTEAIEVGHTNHRDWVEHVFAPRLRPLRGATRRQAVLAVVAATDIYIWKLLRRDYGLERAEAERSSGAWSPAVHTFLHRQLPGWHANLARQCQAREHPRFDGLPGLDVL